MSKKFLFLFMVLLLLPASLPAGEESPWEARLPFENATIHFTISGMEDGSEVIYIREYGREVATYHTTKTSILGMITVNETVAIDNPDWLYQFDLTDKTGTKSVNPEKYMIEEYNKLSEEEQKLVVKNGEKIGIAMAEGFGGAVQQNVKIILDYSCDRAEMMGTVAYTIHGSGVPLLVESNMMGLVMKIEATSIDVGEVADKYFQFPEGIEAHFDPGSDAIAREMAKQTIAGLKNPENVEKENLPILKGQKPQMTPEEQEQMQQAMELLKGMFGTQPQQ